LCLAITCCAALLAGSPSATQARILVHGRNALPDFRDDGLLMSHLETRFGEENVDYMAAIDAAADGSSANGYDAIIISSSMGSNDIRGKYANTPVGVLNMENAIIDTGVGEFQLSFTSGTTVSFNHQHVEIVDPTHPLAAGLTGTVQVFNNPQFMQVGRGDLGQGVHLVARQPENVDGTRDHTIFAVDTGGALLGDGSPGSPAVAAGRRVMFFVSDPGFGDLTADGLKLFDAAANWVIVPEPASFALCAVGLFTLLARRPHRRN
jgi:hypothetical protein